MNWQKFTGKRQKIGWVTLGVIVATISSAAVVIEPERHFSPIDETKLYISKSIQTNCNFELPEVIEANTVRLTGSSCKLESLVNKTNGFTASLFVGSEKKWSTDFIYLSEGDNDLKIEYFDSKGQLKERSIKILGRSPASIVN